MSVRNSRPDTGLFKGLLNEQTGDRLDNFVSVEKKNEAGIPTAVPFQCPAMPRFPAHPLHGRGKPSLLCQPPCAGGGGAPEQGGIKLPEAKGAVVLFYARGWEFRWL